MSSTIFEVLGCGPIVAGDEAKGYLVTINGSYLNLWSSVVRKPGTYGGAAVLLAAHRLEQHRLPPHDQHQRPVLTDRGGVLGPG